MLNPVPVYPFYFCQCTPRLNYTHLGNITTFEFPDMPGRRRHSLVQRLLAFYPFIRTEGLLSQGWHAQECWVPGGGHLVLRRSNKFASPQVTFSSVLCRWTSAHEGCFVGLALGMGQRDVLPVLCVSWGIQMCQKKHKFRNLTPPPPDSPPPHAVSVGVRNYITQLPHHHHNDVECSIFSDFDCP